VRTSGPISSEALSKEPYDFSLMLGGPLYQLCRRTHLSGDTADLIGRRIIVVALVAWVPLLLLSLAEGHAWGGSVKLPFLYDVETHIRLLLAVPLLILGELVVHRRLRPVAPRFVEDGLIPDNARARFEATIAAALRLRNSVTAEAALLAAVYCVGVLLVWRTQTSLDIPSWYGMEVDGELHPSLAGWWLGCVSLPLFQFLLLRWYFRLFIWARFLWQVSGIELQLMPMHPDQCGGISFLGGAMSFAFLPLLLAQGALLAGMIANRIFYAGAKLPEFEVELVGLVVLMVFAILGPLLVFCRKLEAAKRTGLREFGSLAQRYVREFNHKWLCAGAPASEPLIGSADIQSLADLANSYEAVKRMRWIPFTLHTVLQLAVATLLPVTPLLLTMMSVEQFLEKLLKIIF
jgi:hypothetical protein